MEPLPLLILSLFVFLALRIPIAFALLLSSLCVIVQLKLPLATLPVQVFSNINTFTLLAIPFFLLLGRLLNEGGITDRLLAFANAVLGHVRGSLGHVNVFVSMMFASLSGSASADTASLGAILIPAMRKAGYHGPYTVAITAASSTLGNIIPPSIIMVIYGAFGSVSIGALFLAGIVPGLMIGIGQMIYTYLVALKYDYPSYPRRPLSEMGRELYRSSPALVVPVLVIGGITGGLFTPTEAAVVAVAYAFVLSTVVYRRLPMQRILPVLSEAAIDYAIPIFAIAAAGIFGWLINYLGAPELVEGYILSLTNSSYGIFALLIAFLLLIGTFLSPMTAGDHLPTDYPKARNHCRVRFRPSRCQRYYGLGRRLDYPALRYLPDDRCADRRGPLD